MIQNLDNSVNIPKKFNLLLNAFINKSAMCFVGAGASIPSNFPDWRKFIENSLNEIKSEFPNKKFNIATEFLRNGDFITAAELINIGTNKALTKKIDIEFSKEYQPSRIHQAISRLPFSFVITTNFDSLIEKSYENRTPVLNWSEIDSLYSNSKRGKFSILKLHGDGNNKNSYIFDKKEYANSLRDTTLNSYLLNIMLSYTTLFVGSSLRDPDLLAVLERGTHIYKENFGPHFAILFKNEVDEDYEVYLRENYSIELIIIDEVDSLKKTDSVVNFLKFLSGNISYNSTQKDDSILMNSVVFNFNDLVVKKIRQIIDNFPVDDVFVYFIDDRDLPKLQYFFRESFDVSRSQYSDSLESFEYYPFLIAKELVHLGVSHEIFEINDITSIHSYPNFLKNQYSLIKLNPVGDKGSILMSAFTLDGQTVGVLILKSKYSNNFSQIHKLALQEYSEIFSSLFRKLDLRSNNVKKNNLSIKVDKFQEILDTSLLLRGENMCYILYEIDYRTGKLWAFFDKKKVLFKNPNPIKYKDGFYYHFEDKSFANHVLLTSKEEYFVDIKKAIELKMVSEDGVKAFDINTRLFGSPIKVNNFIGFILVAWPKIDKSTIRIHDKITRIASLIANSNFDGKLNFENAEKFISNINLELTSENLIPPWAKRLNNSSFRYKIIQILFRNLIAQPVNISRLRLWLYDTTRKIFVCHYSLCSKNSIFDNNEAENTFTEKKITSEDKDEYCQFTLKRFENNPFTIQQHVSMFSKPDKNNEKLFKDPNGKWMVCPIVNYNFDKGEGRVIKKTLLGYISADNHVNIEGVPKDRNNLTISQVEFQKYALDLVADLLAPVINFESFELFIKPYLNEPLSNK